MSDREINNLRDIADKLMDFSHRMEVGPELPNAELAEVVGLQIALDAYKELLDVSDMENKDFFDYI